MVVKIKKDIVINGLWWEAYAGSNIFFEVEECSVDDYYYIVSQGEHKNLFISKSDCEIINEVTSVIPVINEYQEPDYQTTISELKDKIAELEAEITELKKQLPKYKVGEEVYYMLYNKIVKSKIRSIKTTLKEKIDLDDEMMILYDFYGDSEKNYSESYIFETVEDLINNLKENI